jgi:putative peptidoglycan lipid II flippase
VPSAEPEEPPPPPDRPGRRGVAANTALFALATGLSRVVGLFREILASSYFATSGAFSAFTIAFQLPNLLRSLVADQAVSAAFVPVFTDLLEQKRRREAFQLASSLFLLILIGLGTLTVLFVLLAPVVMPLLSGGSFSPALKDLTAGLSRLLFPGVLLLGLTGLTLGILYAYDDFMAGAIGPLVWNVVIIGVLVGIKPLFHGPDQLYAYAIGVLAGTIAQFAITLPKLRSYGFRLIPKIDLKDRRIREVLTFMLPVTVSLGLINFSLLINSSLGSLVSDQAPRAIDAAFRIYQLPQGVFSIALATVLFPTLARYATRKDVDGLRRAASNGTRQNFLLLIPAAVLSCVLAEPIVRLIYQHGEFGPGSTEQVKTALFWFSFSLPFNGVNLLLTRTFFSFQRPWLPTALAGVNVLVNVGVSAALYGPYGIGGIVVGTLAGNLVMTVGQLYYLRRELHGFEGRKTVVATVGMLAASALLGLAAYGVWYGLDQALGRALIAQIASVGTACVAGIAVYMLAVWALRIEEGRQIGRLIRGRLRRGRTT